MSKQEMARTLINRGCTLAFNTLRKYSVDRLEAMLQEQHQDTQLAVAPVVAAPAGWPAGTESWAEPIALNVGSSPEVPTDAEIYAAAITTAPEIASDPKPVHYIAPLALLGALLAHLWYGVFGG